LRVDGKVEVYGCSDSKLALTVSVSEVSIAELPLVTIPS